MYNWIGHTDDHMRILKLVALIEHDYMTKFKSFNLVVSSNILNFFGL